MLHAHPVASVTPSDVALSALSIVGGDVGQGRDDVAQHDVLRTWCRPGGGAQAPIGTTDREGGTVWCTPPVPPAHSTHRTTRKRRD